MEKVTFGEGIPGYECGDKTAPAIIVLQEWWGVSANIQKQAGFISSKVSRIFGGDPISDLRRILHDELIFEPFRPRGRC